MKPLYTELEFNSAKTSDLLPCQCYICENTFYKLKRVIQRVNVLHDHKGKYCSKQCQSLATSNKIEVSCLQCNTKFYKLPNQCKKHPRHFCSHSCNATYYNTHKTHGTRRSKLEIWLEEQLTVLYPNLIIDFNKKDTINSELDIYIPSLKLAFELNGIYHYEPIHGKDKLDQIKNNDHRKFQACAEKEISLCIIDTSLQKYVKPKTSQKFLDIIINIINSKN